MAITTKTTKAPKAGAIKSSPSVNPAMQYFNFKKYERQVFETLGTVRSLFGADAHVEIPPKNFNSDENCYFVITLPNGESSSLSISSAVSDMLRSQEITIGQACNLPVNLRPLKGGDNAGQMRPMIMLPQNESNRLTGGKAVGELDDKVFDPASINKAFNAPAW
jgi:hypothetical protein